jgi:opacity protein-like surface antigen
MKQIFLMILTVCCLMITTAAQAQNFRKQDVSKHELSIYGLVGYSPLSYTLSKEGAKSGGIGGGAGLGYTFNINPSLGIVTGVEMATYTSEASFDNIPDEYNTGTGNDLFRFSYSLNNYRETQNLTLFSIPVMAQYSLPLGSGSTKFYVSGGLKLGFPVKAEADITPGTATVSGYLAYEHVEYEDLPQHGFGSNISLPKTKKDIDLGFSTALVLETGVHFALTGKTGLYTGVYFSYGLNSIQQVNDKHLLEYEIEHLSDFYEVNERPFLYHSLLNTGFADKVSLMSVGLKLRISFKL